MFRLESSAVQNGCNTSRRDGLSNNSILILSLTFSSLPFVSSFSISFPISVWLLCLLPAEITLCITGHQGPAQDFDILGPHR